MGENSLADLPNMGRWACVTRRTRIKMFLMDQARFQLEVQ